MDTSINNILITCAVLNSLNSIKLSVLNPSIKNLPTEYNLFDIKHGEKVLHIGSGSFPLSEIILSEVAHAKVIGIDRNPKAIKRARLGR